MRRKRKHRNRRRRLIVLTVMFLVAAGLAAGIGWMIFGRNTDNEKELENKIISSHTKEIMVMGVDPRTDDTGRSDTLMLISLDTEMKRASVLSVPRDTRVEMGKGTYEKINHAYAYGGHEYTKKILENLLTTQLDGYILVDIRAFERMIDAVGGVDVDVEKRMFYEDPWDEDGGLVIDLQPGDQHMNGKQAMQYVRFRDEEGDIGRIARQQKFMQALLARVTSPEVIPHLGTIVRELTSVIDTDIEAGELIRYVALLPDIKAAGVVSYTLPGKPGWWQETSYWVPDIPSARKLFAEQIGASYTPANEAKALQDLELYAESLPKGLADVNGTLRIISAENGNAIHGNELFPAAVSKAASESKAATESDEKKNDNGVRAENIRIRVLNCSGISGAAAKSADILRERGFLIDDQDVGNGPVRDKVKTTLTVPKGTEKLFGDLPFPCIVLTGEEDTAVLEIGRDYNDA